MPAGTGLRAPRSPAMAIERLLRVGTAGWSLPSAVRDAFGADGSALHRYASRLDCAEINSSFYRPHRPQTYARWAASVPQPFRFSVKVPRTITHDARLIDCGALLDAFLDQVTALGDKLGPLLIQLPPSLAFDAEAADAFFTLLRARFAGDAVFEPRHASWFAPEVDTLLRDRRIARVAADPAPHPVAGTPGGWAGLRYWRLHGAPRMYFSAYDDGALTAVSEAMKDADAQAWCIFDNTASGAAIADALSLNAKLRKGRHRPAADGLA